MDRGAGSVSGFRTKAATPEDAARRPLVLIVEDSALASGAIALLLRETGHDVQVAATVREAIAACVARRPDVMLLDLTLPDGEGLAVLDHARSAGVEPRITAALTGHDDADVAARCAASGCRAVLTKPVPARDLVRLVREWTSAP